MTVLKDNKITNKEINKVYERINNIRKKYGLAEYDLLTISQYEKINSSTYKDIKNKMEATTKEATYVENKTYNFGNIEIGSKILELVQNNIEKELTVLEGICNNCNDNFDRSIDTSYRGDYTNNSKCSYHGDYRTDCAHRSDDSPDYNNCPDSGHSWDACANQSNEYHYDGDCRDNDGNRSRELFDRK